MDIVNGDFTYHKAEHFACLSCRQRLTEELYLTFCGVEQCTPGYTVGPRIRNNYHLHVVLSGKGTLSAAGKTIPLHAAQAFLLKPGEPVLYQADEQDPWRYCWVSLNGVQAKRYMEAAGFPDGVNAKDCYVDGNEFLLLVNRLLECTELTVFNELRRQGLAMEYLALMIESTARGEQARRRHDYSPDVYVEHALDVIRYQYATVKVSDVARSIGINRSYLTSIFKKKTGFSPQEYLLQCRLNAARDLLLNTDHSVQEVARQVGYENPLTFSKMFKNAYGVSPRNYRLQAGSGAPEEAES